MNGFDDFSRPMEYISPLDRHFRSVLRRYIEQEVMPFRRQYDEDWKDHAIIEPAFDKLMGELGLQKALFPPEHGGWGITRSDYIFRFAYMLCEELGRADTGMAVALAVTFWPLLVILVEPFVNERLIAEFAPMSVSYTHLTLPTIHPVEISVVAVALKKKHPLHLPL